MAAEIAGGVVGLVLLAAMLIGLWSMLRRSRKFLTALRVANENRNRARSTSQSSARATAGVDFGGVHLHVPGTGGTTDDDDRALIGRLVQLHADGRINDLDLAAALRRTGLGGPSAITARRDDLGAISRDVRAVGNARDVALGSEHLT